ncbi:hypothetical protein [Aquisediminimonas sediminicola]|uniref:hypothetical protein n=1 Tax=Alteraquisediminimonas sediminicola TaxID=2676787 RepID=UPI001C8E83FA|nr:hypothetical protein [Aquisediminimonas sediminicola]
MNFILALTRRLIAWAISTHIVTLSISVGKAQKAAIKADNAAAVATQVVDRAIAYEDAAHAASAVAVQAFSDTTAAVNAEIATLRTVAA